ncbi:hypothetical protein IAT38_003571 [Cryptococcus sp. DSM 104549]
MADNTIEPMVEPDKLSSWRLRSPAVQNIIGATVQGLCPGIYVSIVSMGAGGGQPTSAHFSNVANLIVYCIFSISCIACGPLVNLWGPRICLSLGASGYAMYVGGLWYFSVHGTVGFPYFASAYLGVTAGFLWVSSSYISQAYAEEKHKARYITVQYIINLFGGLIGGAVAFGANYNKSSAGGVQGGVYAAYIALHCVAGLLALFFIVDPRTVRRNDGTHIAVFKPHTVKQELTGMVKAFSNPRIALFIPAAIAMDFYQAVVGSWNSATFSLRGRGLNAMMGNCMNILSVLVFNGILSAYFLKTRRLRIGTCLAWGAFLNLAAWLGWIGWMVAQGDGYVRKTTPALDYRTETGKWAKGFVVFLSLNFMAPVMRNFVYYMAAVATNHPQSQAHLAAIIHAAPQWGQVMAFAIDITAPPYMRQAACYLGVIMATIVLAAYGVWKYSTETLWGTEEGVIVPIEEARRLGLQAEAERARADAGMAPTKEDGMLDEKDLEGGTTVGVQAVKE